MNTDTNGAIIVERMDSILKTKGLNRNDLCKALGFKNNTLSTWKTRGTIPAADVAIMIADFLGVSVRYLVTGECDRADEQEQSELLRQWAELSQEQQELFMLQIKAVAQKKT